MSKSLDIMNNIVSTLKGINGSPSYNNTMRDRQVSLGNLHPDIIPKDGWPHFAAVLNEEPREREPGRYRKELIIDIVCSFRRKKDSPIEPWLEDVEVSLLQDVKRGGYAFETFVSNIQRETELNEDIQIYVMTVSCPTLVNFGTT